MKNKFVSKREVVDLLLKEVPPSKKFEKWIVIVEHKKLSENVGLTKAEIVQNGKVVLKGGGTQHISKNPDGFSWSILKHGESYFEAYYLDASKQSVVSLFKEGILKSIKEGKIPFK